MFQVFSGSAGGMPVPLPPARSMSKNQSRHFDQAESGISAIELAERMKNSGQRRMPGMWKGFGAETLVTLLFSIVRFPVMSTK